MMKRRYLLYSLILALGIWLLGVIVQASEDNASCQISPGPKPVLGLLEYDAGSPEPGTPVRFVLYSDRTVIYRDRMNRHTGFTTGTVDEETWQTFKKILAELPAVKTNFAFSVDEGKANSLIIFDDGKLMRQLSIYGPISARKTGPGKVASYSTLLPAIKVPSPMFGGGEVPQSAIGAWYETHYFVPKDAHPWVPDQFEVSLRPGAAAKTVSWPANWPQPSAGKSLSSGGHSLQMPGRYLNEYERLFGKSYTQIRISGETMVVSYSVSLPSQHELLRSVPLGVQEESLRREPPLPQDFMQKTKVSELKKIARERNYDMNRIVSESSVSDGVGFVSTADVIVELCQSKDPEQIDTGLELTLEAKRSPLHAASVFASTHTPELTQALIVRHIADGKFLEVITPLIQESVARGADYESVEGIRTYWQKLRKQNEPLAWLPLHRVDIEQSACFPSYGGGGSVRHLASNSVQGKLEKEPPGGSRGTPFTAAARTIDQEAAARCVRSWKKHSNGKSEAKLFETSSAICATDVSSKQLLKLDLECLEGATAGELKVDAVAADRIYAIVFGAASCGGAYPPGEEGAYGRLAAWQSLAALVGLDASASFDDVYSAVKQSSWFSMASTSKWFHNIAWDMGILCLRPDKKHIAVLAASDED